MATRNLVPRANGEGKVGTAQKKWAELNAENTYNKTETDSNITSAIDALKDNVATDGDTLAKLRGLIQGIQTLLNSNDVNLDVLQEIVDYIKNNKSLIDGITTSKVSVLDIINNLTSIETNKPLSAAQGKALKDLIDALDAATYSKTETDSNITNAINALKDNVAADGDTLAKLRGLIQGIQTLLNSNDVNLDVLQEIVDYIKNNKSLIDGITTSKVNVSDIADNLTSTATNKPLSAKQGKLLNESKVDKTTGKGLSTEDYTTDEKTNVASNTKDFTKLKQGDYTNDIKGIYLNDESGNEWLFRINDSGAAVIDANHLRLTSNQSTLETVSIILRDMSSGYIDWGDGNKTNITTGVETTYTHDFLATGTYIVKIGGKLTELTKIESNNQAHWTFDIAELKKCSGLVEAYFGYTSVTGDIAALSGLTGTASFNNTSVTGDIAALSGLTGTASFNATSVTGDIAALSGLTGSASFSGTSVTGDIAALSGLTGSAYFGYTSVTGNISALSGLTGTAYFDSTSVTGWVSNITTIQNLYYYNCNLTTEMVDNNLINLDAAGLSNGTLSIAGNNAPRSAASDIAYNNLISKGWTITVNN